MIRLALLSTAFALQDGAPPPTRGARSSPSPRDSAAMVSQLAEAEHKFFAAWRTAWMASESRRARDMHQLPIMPRGGSGTPGKYNPRQADVICYFFWEATPGVQPLVYQPDDAWGIDPIKRAIGSKKNSRHWVCPNWLPPDDFYLPVPHLPDERISIDGALEPVAAEDVKAARSRLINQFQAVSRQLPGDNFVVGQLVRLLLDAGARDAALAAARNCAADRWWCLALTGYAYHRLGFVALADAAFSGGIEALAPSERCKWTDIAVILEGETHREYSRMPCADRAQLNSMIWWLADPLWSAGGNDRRSEQFARNMSVLLHSATGRDERYNWLPEGGGDALTEMVMRYGWPSYTYAGYGAPPVRFPPPPPPSYGYVLLYQPKPKGPPIKTRDDDARKFGGIKTSYEYSLGRLELIPAWSMILDPFSIKSTDWDIAAKGGDWDHSFKWWPHEHYAPVHPFVEILDQQTAFLRRQDSTLLAYATNLSQTDLTRRVGDTVRGVLVVSPGPESMTIVGDKKFDAVGRMTFLAPLPKGPSMVSAEIPWDSEGRRGARARFGVTPPPPLSSMGPSETAISEPVLLVVPADIAALPIIADSTVPLMRGSTTLATGTNSIGVYWETYGFTQLDSVAVSLTIQRTSSLGLLRSLGAVTGITGNANAPISIAWNEPQPGHDARTLRGAVPIQMRSIILNISTLPAGEYTLEISVGKSRGTPVRSTREFTVR